VVDEADALLVDEARIPMVIAAVHAEPPRDPRRLADLVRDLGPDDWEISDEGRAVHFTQAGLERCEAGLGCGSLSDTDQIDLYTALGCALHAHVLIRRDEHYIVRDGNIEMVDEFTGRVAEDRKWPWGLQTALEAKEGLALHPEGTVLDAMTVSSFLASYPNLTGMTATARGAAGEIRDVHGIQTVIIPPNRPCERRDHPDRVYTTRKAKLRAVVEEIRRERGAGRPVLVGTRTVAESEELARRLEKTEIPCRVLNARNDEREAAIVAEAGDQGAVTISTNMAGRGTDIRLGGSREASRESVAAAGGLHVIGTNRHESRRIDDQLRGRAGRQGDPGSSRFIVSVEDDLVTRYGLADGLPGAGASPREDGPLPGPLPARCIERAQRIIEGRHASTREKLRAYSAVVETQRRLVKARREAVRDGEGTHAGMDAETRRRTLIAIDLLWSEHLCWAWELRESVGLERVSGGDPLREYGRRVAGAFEGFEERVREMAQQSTEEPELQVPEATWTYLVEDDPFHDGLGSAIAGDAGIAALAGLNWPLLMIHAAVRRLSWRPGPSRRRRPARPGSSLRQGHDHLRSTRGPGPA